MSWLVNIAEYLIYLFLFLTRFWHYKWKFLKGHYYLFDISILFLEGCCQCYAGFSERWFQGNFLVFFYSEGEKSSCPTRLSCYLLIFLDLLHVFKMYVVSLCQCYCRELSLCTFYAKHNLLLKIIFCSSLEPQKVLTSVKIFLP